MKQNKPSPFNVEAWTESAVPGEPPGRAGVGSGNADAPKLQGEGIVLQEEEGCAERTTFANTDPVLSHLW